MWIKVVCSMEEFYIRRKVRCDTTRTEGDMIIIQLALYKILPISPIPICVTILGDWQKWYEEKAMMKEKASYLNGAFRRN